jgi:PPOX class probable F420-dependent enzyme
MGGPLRFLPAFPRAALSSLTLQQGFRVGSLWPEPPGTGRPHQNRPAGGAPVRRRRPQVPSCDASTARASICACLACNTPARPRAMEGSGRVTRPRDRSVFSWIRIQCWHVHPPQIRGQKYIALITFRRNGEPVSTPVWFGEKDDRLYVMTRSDSGKYKRIRNNPRVRSAPCTMRGKITGPEFPATAGILPPEDWPWAAKPSRKSIGWRESPSCGARRMLTWKSKFPLNQRAPNPCHSERVRHLRFRGR